MLNADARREAVGFFASALPIAMVDGIKLLIPALSTMVAGHDDTTTLAAASLGVLTFNVCGNMIATAPLSAMDTIAPQAYGAGNVVGVGLTAQRALILSALFLLPTIPLWACARTVLVALRQSSDVAERASKYMLLLLPGLAPLTVFEVVRKYLYAQGSSMALRLPPLLAALVGLALHPLWLALWCSCFGYMGAAVAMSMSYLTQAVVLIGWVRWRLPTAAKAWPSGGHRKLLWRDKAACLHMLKTSLAALCSLTEWLYWEVVCFRVGTLGTTPLAVYGIAYSIEPVVFMLPLGLSTGIANAVCSPGIGDLASMCPNPNPSPTPDPNPIP